LVLIGTSASYGYSVVSTFAPSVLPDGMDYSYFEASAVIITLVLLGRFLETSAKGRMGDAIRRLLKLQAVARRVVRDGGGGGGCGHGDGATWGDHHRAPRRAHSGGRRGDRRLVLRR